MTTKQAFLVFILSIMSFLSKAQDKHEYLTIEYLPIKGQIAISMDGKDFTKENVDYSKHDKSSLNANPLLEKVKAYESQGWEVVTLSLNHAGTGVEVYYSYMRKKRDEKK